MALADDITLNALSQADWTDTDCSTKRRSTGALWRLKRSPHSPDLFDEEDLEWESIEEILEERRQQFIRELDSIMARGGRNNGRVGLTVDAYRKAVGLITYLYSRLDSDAFPDPSFIPDGEGGIDIEWESDGKEIMMSCRAKPEDTGFIYLNLSDVPHTDLDTSPDRLYQYLRGL
jgi:hypothetical protein